MFGRKHKKKTRHYPAIILSVLGSALGATAFYTVRKVCQKKSSRIRLGQVSSREHIRMSS